MLLEVSELLVAVVLGGDGDCFPCMLSTEEGEDEHSFIDNPAIPRCPEIFWIIVTDCS